MRHRDFSNSFTRSGIDQHDSNHTPAEQSYFPTGRAGAPENGPFVGQMNHMPRGGHSSFHQSSSNVSMEVQPFAPTFSGSNVNPYSHSSITENRDLASVTPVGQHIHCTSYNVPSTHDMEAGLMNCPTGNGGPLKRKRSGISGPGSIFSAGSSSSSSQIPMEKSSVDCQNVPQYRGSLTIGSEDSSRNVRRRYRLDLDPTRTHVPNHSSHLYQSTPHPENYFNPVHRPNVDANGRHLNCVLHYDNASSHRRISSSDISGSRHETNWFHAGGSSSFSGHHVSSSHGPSMREGQVNHSRRSQPSYGNGSRYSHYARGGTSSPSENFSSRNSRHFSSGGWHRPRMAVDRLHSVLDITESHDRIGHETMMMVDRASFYGNSSSSDHYRDLRLDIDNMSYEELLNLEERIGNVSTGLSEESMSKCLREKLYYSSEQNHEEVSCPICLEGYKDCDKIARMEKCGHDYHVDCIKKWLLIKKLCPICKTECSNHEPNQG